MIQQPITPWGQRPLSLEISVELSDLRVQIAGVSQPPVAVAQLQNVDRMSRFSLPLTRLVHENLSVVMCFAYSRKPLAEMMDAKFLGEWKYLNKALFEVSAERAEKACLELALFLRMLDDKERISDYHAATKNVPDCGSLIMKDGSEKALTFREMANKVIHSTRLEWELVKFPDPMLICHTSDAEKWLRAEVNIVTVAKVCGELMS